MAGNPIPWNKHAPRPTVHRSSDPGHRRCPVRSGAADGREGGKEKSRLARPWWTRAEKGTAGGWGWEPPEDQGVVRYGWRGGLKIPGQRV